MSTPPQSPSAKSSASATSPQVFKRKLSRTEHSKPNESWFLILVNAFKSNFEQTLTYRESELYAWIMQAYPYYRHDMHTMQTSVKTTLSSYECFRQNGRSTWTFIPRRALVHLESLKSEEGRGESDHSSQEDENEDVDEGEETLDRDMGEGSSGTRYAEHNLYEDQHSPYEHRQDGSDTRIRYVDKHLDLMDEDSPTLSVEEIQRFKQEHSGAQARKLKRKASGGHASRPRTRSPPVGLQDECSMSMEAWCNLLVQMFEASPKQKTIREIFAWVHDNYPIYRNAPGDAWQKDLTAALESNPLFKAMGRGRWQMVTQASHPVIVLNDGNAVSGIGTTSNPSVKAEDDATDSPSVTEDEDWKAIGSKRLLNFSFRRYSIATDTFPKNHYNSGSTVSANAMHYPTSGTGPSMAIAAASLNPSLSVAASTSNLLPIDHRPAVYTTTGRRFSSYHQPTPKNSPPLLATTSGLSMVDEFGTQLKGAISEETDDEEDPARRYMAPLQNAINSAVLALQSQHSRASSPTSMPVSSAPQTNSSSLQGGPAIVISEGAYLDDATSSSAPVAYLPLPQQEETKHQNLAPEVATASITTHDNSASNPPTENGPRLEPEIVIPNGEDLASDQMDAIQALALLCGGGV
ncbi:hypothetical protein BC939DRAFT_437943 [Gamsiella multidivaricata]|uniref:uncharacterized protein n=1 Tax=Gamsiella multidivaricata TaxID=101098 RepID=UPI00221F7C52|nr:uncharacterized protein BC939DRAFT_437943 [Gamsiella multidivaricata]KAG0362176.1 hypothetical protein BGZ54_008755 [Gamsiella multidivaricata]KAI7831217.1 hypothetical protein BC939DRAFT_437943 [Gamsiella multidivaricata]